MKCRYDGTVTAVATSGNFIVDFEGYGTQEEVDRQSMRQRPVSTDAGTGYKGMLARPDEHVLYRCGMVLITWRSAGVEAPKQRRVSDDTDVQEMPAWLEIKPTGISACRFGASFGCLPSSQCAPLPLQTMTKPGRERKSCRKISKANRGSSAWTRSKSTRQTPGKRLFLVKVSMAIGRRGVGNVGWHLECHDQCSPSMFVCFRCKKGQAG